MTAVLPRAALGLALVLTALDARADGTAEVEALLDEPVVSTISKAAETASSAPATSTVITAEDLRRHGVRTLAEAIDYLSLGMVTQRPLRSAEIGARGVLVTGDFGDHTLLLLDGHTLNDPGSGGMYIDEGAAIPIELIDHIEVVLGPGSVLYGSNAMLGVINVITRRAKDFRGTHVVIGGELPTAFRAAIGAGYTFTLLGRPAEVTAEIDYTARRGPAFTFGPQNYGIDAVTGQPKRFTPDGEGTGVWGGVARRSNYGRVPAAYVRLIAGPFEVSARAAIFERGTPYFNYVNTFPIDFDQPDSREIDRWIALDVKHRAVLSPRLSLASRLYGDLYDYEEINISSAAEDCPLGLLNGCQRDYRAHSFQLGLEEQLSLDWLNDGRFETLLAADGRARDLDAKNNVTDRLTGTAVDAVGPGRHTEGALAIYAQQKARLVSWLGLNAGARFDFDQRFGGHLSPRAAATVGLWPGATAKLFYAEAFRAPSAYESYYADNQFFIQADHLVPEIERSLEASFEQRLGTQRLMLGGFRTFFRDLVQLSDATEQEVKDAIAAGKLVPGTEIAVEYKNVGRIDAWGFNAAFEGTQRQGRVRYGVTATAAYSRRDTGAGPQLIAVAPQLFGNARASYELGGALPTVAIAAQVAGPRPADRAETGGFTPTPYAPPQALLRATLSGVVPRVERLSYRLGLSATLGDRGPYVVGPLQFGTPQHPAAELVPQERLRAHLALQYDLPF